jgi:tetratricopeptide (TPR) repeat protein
MSLPRQLASLLLSALLCGSQASAWAGTPPQENSIRPDTKHAQKALQLGERLEAAGQLDEALAAYQEAARYAPEDAEIVEHSAALRSRAVRHHVEAAERNAIEGHMDLATEELGVALRIDPGNTIVAERLSQMKAMESEPPAKGSSEIIGLPRLQPRAGKSNLNLKGDTKTVYEQLAAQFGVRADFDPDLTVRNVTLRVDDVDFYTAVAVLAAETATFWRPLNSSLIFVAEDTQEKRRQYGLQAEQTFPLASTVSTEEATEMLRVLRDITAATRISVDMQSRTITMRDTPEKLALAGEVLRQLDRARGEVMLEIELLEVDKNKARDLGITPPSQEQLILLTTSDVNRLKSSADLNNLLTNLQGILSAKGITTGVSSIIPVGGGLSTFLLTLPSGVANFSDTLSLVQSGRQVLLRAQDGKPATFFVGDRFPITLSLLSGSIGTTTSSTSLTGALAGINFPETQFTVGIHPSALVTNSFTGQTLPDLAVVFNDPSVNTLTILQNQDSGNFVQLSTTPPPFTFSKTETGQVAIGTGVFRNDTSRFTTAQPPDLAVVNSTSNNVSVLLGNADANGLPNGTFTAAPQSPLAVGTNPSAIIVADFNGDGFLDLAVANQGDNSISLFRGDGSGNFTPYPGSPFKLTNTSTVSEKGPIAMVSGNFRNTTISATSGAPEVDLAVVNQQTNNVTILLSSVDQNGNVTFTEAPNSPMAVGNFPVAIATADLNGDGVPDLGVVNQSDNSVTILLGSTNLDGTFTQAQNSPLQTASKPAGIVMAGFASGVSADIAVTNESSNTLSVFLNEGGALFAQPIELNTPTGPSALIAAALTSSGLPDVALVAQDPAASQGVVAVIQDSSSLASAATGAGAGQTPYPGSEYVDLGVKIKATPTLHPNNEVTLQLEFEIRALSGLAINGIPIISNRTLTQTVRVREDEPSLLAGLTDNEETRTITGLPGFAEIPGAGYAFGTRSNSLQDSELLIVITPRKLRLADHLTRTIFAGRAEPVPTSRRGLPPEGVPQSPTPQQPPP